MDNIVNDSERLSPLLEYGITKAVLQNLPNIQQLNKAATVCKSWNETAKIIKKSRHQIYCASNAQSYDDCSCIEKVISIMRSQPSLCIVFLTHENVEEAPYPIHKLNTGGLLPAFNFKGRCTEYGLLDYLKNNMPSNCIAVGGLASGVVMSGPTLETNEVEEGAGYGLMFLPEISSLSVRKFYLDKSKIKGIGKALTSQPDQVDKLLNLRQEDQVKCALILGTDAHKESKCIEAICQYLQEKKNENVAIGGGFMEAVIHPDVPDFSRDHGILGLVFCGSEVRSNSVLIPYDVTSEADIERLILQLKDYHTPAVGEKRKSIGFMVACVARGIHVHGRSNVESAIFRKHFPSTPLLGFFGNGEIGINCLNGASSATDPHSFRNIQHSAPKKSRTTYLHSYATTFSLVSFPVE